MNGQLSEHPLAELIREISHAGLSGALRLSRGLARAVVYAEGGAVVLARSNLRAHRLGDCARRSGLVAPERLAAAVTELMTEAEAAEALSSVLSADELAALRAWQTEDVMRPFLVWTEGDWDFDPRARPAEDLRVRLGLRQLLLEGARHLPAEFAAARLADDAETVSPAPAGALGSLRLLPAEGFVLSRVEAPTPLGQLLTATGLPDAEARRAVYALALVGLLERERWPRAFDPARAARPAAAKAQDAPRQAAPEAAKPAAPQPAKADEPDPRAEMEELLARVEDADHFELLGVGREAQPPEIKRAYYALAKRFHPDRFRQVADDEERVAVETAFAQITKAYETLQNATARAAYVSKLGAPRAGGAAGGFFSKKRAQGSKVSVRGEAKAASDQGPPARARAEESYEQGLAALQRGDGAAARLALAEAVRLDPQQARYHALFGRALMTDAGLRRQAEYELQAAIRLDPKNAAHHVVLAELYRALGLQRRAEGELARALSLDPGHEPARRMLREMKGKDEG
jgi:DnaJ-domain-containing protein 1